MKKQIIGLLALVFLAGHSQAQVNVEHYTFNLQLTDRSDTIYGKANIIITFTKATPSFTLNLTSVKNGKGMRVSSITESGAAVPFTHKNDLLTITPKNGIKKNENRTFWITYAGVPADGMIISKNKYGDRTFFADNWPNRAQQWLPCNDHPSDKASVEFIVTAPDHYRVIGNGVNIEETKLGNAQMRTHWIEGTEIPTKVMVIGAARFAVKEYTDSSRIHAVSAWVYPQDSSKGFYDYALAPSILRFFHDYIGAYEFRKLANVQSKTIFGGMENASAIFYSENTVTGTRESEALLAHEIAHQWFGNMASEKSFAHLWLSEGFATYMTHYYLEQKYGADTLRKRMIEDRETVINFSKRWNKPVVDSVSPLMDLLNANSYQKGGWVLHMLRNEVGDKIFDKIIQSYYAQYKGGNADTWDFKKVAERVSGKNLDVFFKQWLFTPGVPQLAIKAGMSPANNALELDITQEGPHLFDVELVVEVVDEEGTVTRHQVRINCKETKATIKAKGPVQVSFDPDVTLLYWPR